MMVHQVLSEQTQGPTALTRDTLRPGDNSAQLSHSNCEGARTQRQDRVSRNHPVHVFVFKTTFWRLGVDYFTLHHNRGHAGQ